MSADPAPDFLERPRVLRWWDDGSSFVLVRTCVLRLLGLVYFVAFGTTVQQGPALIGEHGLLPMGRWLDQLAAFHGSRLAAFASDPSVFWLGHSDGALLGAAWLGVVLSIAVMAGVTNAGVMLVLWILQLSIHAVGQVFWGYGWEIQLLETGMIAVFLCPLRGWRPFATTAPPAIAVWLMRWLVVRIMLGAGLIKLRGDPCWTDLTCLVFHYETQPNPSPLSPWFHAMPRGFHVVGALVNHLVEVVAPIFVFGPRVTRRVAGALFVGFQLLLIASGNLAFLNWLTIVPALACFDDALLEKVLRRRLSARARPAAPLHRKLAIGYAAIVGILSVGPVVNLLSSHQAMNASFDPLHLVNTYGAFGSVSRVRNEVVIEGTREPVVTETTRWEEYELPCKPGDPKRRPCLVTPWHYRLDWQMWFAAMSSYEDEPWLGALVDHLLRGDRATARLFARDPFPDAPPRFVRAELFHYELAREAGIYWKRTRIGEYMRPLSLGDRDLDLFLREHDLK